MAAKKDRLEELHGILAEVMLNELRWYMSQDPPIPVPAADKSAVAKFLKDNNVTADPMDGDALEKLRAEFQAEMEGRRKTAPRSVVAAKTDLDDLYPDMRH
jgi:hypothetical protein